MRDAKSRRRGHFVWIKGRPDPHPCAPDEKVLSALERDQVGEVRVGCRQGGCGACRVRVISGGYHARKMSRAHVTEAEQAEGYALACRIYPTSDLVIEPAFVHPKERAMQEQSTTSAAGG